MKLAVARTTTAIAAFATAGVSSIFMGVAPASAATIACGEVGTLVSAGICEVSFTSGTATFTPTADMSKLEVLLVGAGGAGAEESALAPNSTGYAAAGGGGEVKIVDFSGVTTLLDLNVAAPGITGSVSDGTTNATVANGANGYPGDGSTSAVGGTSGSGHAGAIGTLGGTAYAAGGGAAASPTSNANGGAGVAVATIAPSGSLFSDVADCYGGGGAIGVLGVMGIPGCGGGGPTDTSGAILAAPAANSGGGGGGLSMTQAAEARAGADGLVVIRWTAAPVTVNFDINGHGTAPASQAIVAGNPAVKPADPTTSGYSFEGWYTDPQLTTLADFSAAVTEPTTYYASWAQVLAVTGGAPNPAGLPLGIAALLAGAGLFAVAHRRKRAAD